MNREQKIIYKMYQEWKFDTVEDLGQCAGVCNCGKKDIRYKYYIENVFTGRNTHVGSRCIDLFSHNMKITAKMSRSLITKGFRGECYKVNSKGRTVSFTVKEGTLLDKHRDIIRKYFKKLPITRRAGMRLVSISVPSEFDMRVFEIGTFYKVKARMKADQCNNLELTMCGFRKVRGKIKHTPFSNPFIRS